MTYTMTLPWPDRSLSPNSRVDRRRNTSVRQRAKWDGYSVAKEAIGPTHLTGPLCVSIVFNPPCNRKRDLDNMLSSIKSQLDGVSQAIGVDDSEWSLSIKRSDVVKGGRVQLTIAQEG